MTSIAWSVLPLRRLVDCWDFLRIPLNAEERGERPGEVPYWGANTVQGYVDSPLLNEEVVLLGEDGAPFFDRDRPVAFHSLGPIWPNNHIHVLKPKPGVVARWLTYALNIIDYSLHVGGSTRDKLTQGAMMRMQLDVPSTEGQRAIADFLDRETAQIDTLIAKQEHLIETLRERRRSLAELAVEHVRTEGERLKHFVAGVTQGWSPQCLGWSADGVETWAVLKAGAVNGGIFRAVENKELPPEVEPRSDVTVKAGQLVISRANTRELVGSAAAVDITYQRLMLCDKLYAFDLDLSRADSRFVALVLGTRRWRDLIELEATGASQSMVNISQSDIVNLPMDLPTVDEQRQILTQHDAESAKIGALIEKAAKLITLAKERRAALITAAVSGQVDLTAA